MVGSRTEHLCVQAFLKEHSSENPLAIVLGVVYMVCFIHVFNSYSQQTSDRRRLSVRSRRLRLSVAVSYETEFRRPSKTARILRWTKYQRDLSPT